MSLIQRATSLITSTIWAIWQISRTFRNAEKGTQAALATPERQPSRSIDPIEIMMIQRRSNAINRISKLWPSRIQCSQRSYALWVWLEKKGFSPTMEVGWFGRKAHAWVRIGETVLNDSPQIGDRWVSFRKESNTQVALKRQKLLSEQHSHWLIAIAAIQNQLGIQPGLSHDLLNIENWDNFFRSTDMWKVGPAVEAYLQNNSASIPEFVNDMVKKRTAFRRAKYTATLLELFQLCEDFRKNNVQYIYVKGFSVSANTGADPVSREMVDLDFLVSNSTLKTAHEILVREQYKPEHDVDRIGFPRLSQVVHHEMIYLSPKAILPVELHWRLNEIKFLRNRDLKFFTSRTTELTIAGNKVRSLDPIAATILAALHGTRNFWYQLRWLADFAALIKNIPADEQELFLATCRQGGCLNLIEASLQLTRDLLSLDLPAFANNLLSKQDKKRDELVNIWKELCVPGPGGISRDAAKEKKATILAYPSATARLRQRLSEIVSPDYNLIAKYPHVYSKIHVVFTKIRRRYF
jgi:hypothetical protein